MHKSYSPAGGAIGNAGKTSISFFLSSSSAAKIIPLLRSVCALPLAYPSSPYIFKAISFPLFFFSNGSLLFVQQLDRTGPDRTGTVCLQLCCSSPAGRRADRQGRPCCCVGVDVSLVLGSRSDKELGHPTCPTFSPRTCRCRDSVASDCHERVVGRSSL